MSFNKIGHFLERLFHKTLVFCECCLQILKNMQIYCKNILKSMQKTNTYIKKRRTYCLLSKLTSLIISGQRF